MLLVAALTAFFFREGEIRHGCLWVQCVRIFVMS